MRGRRAEAKAMLTEAQARQERYTFSKADYAGSLADLGYGKGYCGFPRMAITS